MSNADRLKSPLTLDALDEALKRRGLQVVSVEVSQLLTEHPGALAGSCLETRIVVEALARIHELEAGGNPQTTFDFYRLVSAKRHRAGLIHLSKVVKVAIARLKCSSRRLPDFASQAAEDLIERVLEDAASLRMEDQHLIARILDTCAEVAERYQQGEDPGQTCQGLIFGLLQVLGPDVKLFPQLFGAGE
jgi:hypothetical protein